MGSTPSRVHKKAATGLAGPPPAAPAVTILVTTLVRTMVLILLLTGCAPAPGTPPGRGAVDEVLIGATLPLSGPLSGTGRRLAEGYRFAVDAVNRAGGLRLRGGRRVWVRLLLLDDGGTPETAVALARRLLDADRVDLLLGTYSTALVQAQSTVAERAGVPYVTAGTGATAVFRRGYRWLFGVQAPATDEAASEAAWLARQQRYDPPRLGTPTRVALLWARTSEGQDWRGGMLTEAARRPGVLVVVADESFEPGTPEFGALLREVAAARADAVAVHAGLPDDVNLRRQSTTLGLCHAVTLYGPLGDQAVTDPAAPDYLVAAGWWSAELGAAPGAGDRAAGFTGAFGRHHGHPPGWDAALAYEAARSLLAAVETAGGADRPAVRDALARSGRADTVLPGPPLAFPAASGQQARYPFLLQQRYPDGRAPIVYPDADRSVDAERPGIVPNPTCR